MMNQRQYDSLEKAGTIFFLMKFSGTMIKQI